MLAYILVLVFICSSNAQSGAMGKKAVERAKEIQQDLYAVLRTMALPDASITKDTPVTQRFVLEVPGKLLDPNDYDPSKYKSTKYRDEGIIPPIIEENMFRLTDIVPAINPMRGGETGESFTDLYEAVLGQMDVRGFDTMTQDDKERYQTALDYLAQSISDPEDLTRNTTRLGLYVRYQKRYNDARLDMENKIKEAQDKYENTPVEYQLWFQTHYPGMYANVENIFTEWLVFGEKDLVELYKAHLDVESQGAELEKARMSLRSSGKVSLDRASTVYPVEFTPSNWYEYLRVRPQPLSKEQIQVILSGIEARLAMLINMKGTNESADAKTLINKLTKKTDDTKTSLESTTSDMYDKKVTCLGMTLGTATPINETKCKDYRNAQEKMTDLSTTYAMDKAALQYAQFQVNANDEASKSIDGLISMLEVQKAHYTAMLDDDQTQDKVDLPKTNNENDTQDFEAGWMDFEFDSSTVDKTVNKEAKSYATSVSFGAGGFLWGVSGGAKYSKASQDFSQKISEAEMKISAKLLKVTINRPWFKTSLFKSNSLKMLGNQKVSPGQMGEPELIRTLQDRRNTYYLPQYAHAFLLAKDVNMEFQGVDSSVQSHALQESASAHLSGHYGPFSASSSFKYGHSKSKLRVEATADGLRISIPGAQIVGYYVTVVPCFPSNTCQ